jgi:hypothetical protein
MMHEDLKRLEGKVDKLTDAVTRLILVEERQTTQGVRIGEVENRISKNEATVLQVEKRMERWINFGAGAWAVALVIFALAQVAVKLL